MMKQPARTLAVGVLMLAAGCGGESEAGPSRGVQAADPSPAASPSAMDEETARPTPDAPAPAESPETVSASARTSPQALVTAYLERLQETGSLVATANYIEQGDRKPYLAAAAAGVTVRIDSFEVLSNTRPSYVSDRNFSLSSVTYKATGELCGTKGCKPLTQTTFVTKQSLGNPAWELTTEYAGLPGQVALNG